MYVRDDAILITLQYSIIIGFLELTDLLERHKSHHQSGQWVFR